MNELANISLFKDPEDTEQHQYSFAVVFLMKQTATMKLITRLITLDEQCRNRRPSYT